ncbi:MAG: universal stress protein [Chloroflexi bacterium]|nr:universal stress protein [Chloroflexota bacterium]
MALQTDKLPETGHHILERIIVPLDGSARSEEILNLVVPLAERLGSELTFLHVLLPRNSNPARPGEINYPDALHDRTRTVATDYLTEVARHLVQDKARSRVVVAAGRVSEMVLAHSGQGEYGLIAIGSRPRPQYLRWFRESITETVWTNTNTPMLFIPPNMNPDDSEKRGLPQRVVVPINGSTRSDAALGYAGKLAIGIGADVTIVGAKAARSLPLAGDANAILYADEPFEYLGERADRLRDAGLEVTVLRRPESAFDAVLRAANELPDHIVVTTARRRFGIMRRVLGPSVFRLVRHSRNPIIFLPPTYSLPGANTDQSRKS